MKIFIPVFQTGIQIPLCIYLSTHYLQRIFAHIYTISVFTHKGKQYASKLKVRIHFVTVTTLSDSLVRHVGIVS